MTTSRILQRGKSSGKEDTMKRDWSGRPVFELGQYEVSWHKDLSQPFYIIKREAWYRTAAVFADIPWDSVPTFNSFIRACIWLKAHYKELL